MPTSTPPAKLPKEFANAENLPSLPAVAMEILRLSEDDDAAFSEYATVFSRDPVLAAKLLKLANSPLFGLSRQVTDLEEATGLLGLRTVQIMALGFSLVSGLPQEGGSSSFAYHAYWQRSLLFAVAGRELGMQVDRSLADEAFLGGLLSHLGQLVMAHGAPLKYERVLRRCNGWPTAAEERRTLGFDHHDVADSVLRHWNIPDPIRVPVVSWGDAERFPPSDDARIATLQTLMRCAAHIVAIACDEAKGVALSELHAAAPALGLETQQIDTLILVLEHRAHDAMEMMEIPAGETPDHYALLSKAREQMMQISIGTAADLNRAERRSATLESHVRRLSQQLTRDPLTGLGNRSHFDDVLHDEVAHRMRRDADKSLGLLVLDIDGFKSLNDTHGHPAGDEILRTVGQAISGTSRTSDVPARIGGDEFAVIAPSTDVDGLRGFAERLRRFVSGLEINIQGRTHRITVSIGGATLVKPDCADEAKRLFETADRQLYLAKQAGRDRVAIAVTPIDQEGAGA
ncbi:MAG: GGDEF domain-containing protein [Myxococcales bacterium]|nr:GGDEF domain-containing protein [Myxococcales bacterium]